MSERRNNSLNHHYNYRTTEKSVNDFVNSFERLAEILKERYGKRCYDGMRDESPPVIDGSGGGSVIGSIEQVRNSLFDDSEESKYKRNRRKKRRSMQNDIFILNDELKRIFEGVEAGNTSFTSIDALLKFYNEIDHYQSRILAHFNLSGNEMQVELRREDAHELERISAVKQTLRKQMATKFLIMVAPFNKNTNNETRQHSERIINTSGSTDSESEIRQIEHINDILKKFMALFTPFESNSLFIKFLAQRRETMGEVFHTAKLSLPVIEELIEREVYFVDKWFGETLFKQLASDLDSALSSEGTREQRLSINSIFLNRHVPREMTIFKCYIYSLVNICFKSFRDEQIHNFIDNNKREMEEMLASLSISESKIKIIAKIVYEDVLKELREKKLQVAGILEL